MNTQLATQKVIVYRNIGFVRGLVIGLVLAGAIGYGVYDLRTEHTQRLIVANGCGAYDQVTGEFSWRSITVADGVLQQFQELLKKQHIN